MVTVSGEAERSISTVWASGEYLMALLSRISPRSEEHTSELQSHLNLVCRLLLEKKKTQYRLHSQLLHLLSPPTQCDVQTDRLRPLQAARVASARRRCDCNKQAGRSSRHMLIETY